MSQPPVTDPIYMIETGSTQQATFKLAVAHLARYLRTDKPSLTQPQAVEVAISAVMLARTSV